MPTTELALVCAPSSPGTELRETVRKCNRLYWMGARDAARVSPQYAAMLFGVTAETANWLARAPLDEVLDFADAPVVTFRAVSAPALLAPSELRHLHAALRAAGAGR